MRLFILAFSFLLAFSCGESKINEPETQSHLKKGILSIPTQGTYGGGPSLKYNNKSYQIDFENSSPSVYNYVQSISNGQVAVQAVSLDNYSKTYQVKFSGSFIESQCIFNPTATCTNASLSSISVY